MFRFNRRRTSEIEGSGIAARQLSEKHLELAKQIASLEQFICEAPARAAEAELDRMQTIPPPEELGGDITTRLEPEEPARLSRAQVAELRKHRRRNMLVCLCALGAFALAAHWLVSMI